jgi:hypothetical protein
MMPIWKNPEFVRHLRAELRTTRAITVAAVVVAIAVLIWLGCWGSRASEMAIIRYQAPHINLSAERLAGMERQTPLIVWFGFYRFLMYAQLGILTFWSLFSCAQSISGERERKTWDFQRATRLSAGELLTGKLFGEPVLAYFIIACCLPIALLAGLLGRAPLGDIVEAYVFIISGAIFLGVAGLWLSTLFESRSRDVGLIGTFGLYLICALMVEARKSNFPGVAALSPLAGFIPLFDQDAAFGLPKIFGHPVPWLVVSLLLYFTFGAWLVLTLLQTLTKDYAEMRSLSRWQAVGCAAFLNFISYVFYVPRSWSTWDPFVKFMVFENGVILFTIGLAILTSSERLRVWWRARGTLRRALFAEDGPQWPWLAMSAGVGYALLLLGLFVWKKDLGFGPEAIARALVEFVVVLVFITRDITFIQWCRLTRMRAPVLKGILFLGLYYVAAVVLATVIGVHSEARGQDAYALLTPAGAFQALPFNYFSLELYLGIGIQLAMVVLLEMAILARLRHAAGEIALR